jgi:hypothetical protein
MAYKWKPLQRAAVAGGSKSHEAIITATMASLNVSREEAVAQLDAYDAQCEYWRNDIYQVQTRRFHCAPFNADMVHINIRRIDGAAVFDWRHRQIIKNEIVGAECEAFELYPAESRLVDTANKYHIWAFVDPSIRLPVWIDNGSRDIIGEEVSSPPGMRQRRI